ncbi:amidase domain-containing protein [Paenibacillus arenosi]|uniref:Amidase domain-containing protein n=1 Tax=Paenibacillus arenosi TaxID=2774142 RepID=A0ABR9B2Z4_9BACL|nr:amidase domain-containing protein [Paenibacillus arenosi]MBD8500733.1 amidase domain-containing protein [Paenibacillus arenosi]
MRQAWKTTLYAYVEQHNRHEVDERPQALLTPITDRRYVLMMSERRQRLRDWYRKRDLEPIKSQTKAKLNRVREAEGEVHVDLEFHVQRIGQQKGNTLIEERLESERVVLVKEGGDWVIAQIEHATPERKPMSTLLQDKKLMQEHRSATRPFLNRNVLGHSKPANLTPYRREMAVEYAELYWNEPNPQFLQFEVDCTNYVSQCLFAGGAPMNYTGKRELGWWYRGMIADREAWSYSWAVSNSLEIYLTYNQSGLRAIAVDHPKELKLGDVILYDWDGNGHYQHSSIVTSFDLNGMPLVNAHTTNSRHRYWDYQDSYAWTEATAYRFFHITDVF